MMKRYFEPQTAMNTAAAECAPTIAHWDSYRASLLRRLWWRRVRLSGASGVQEFMDTRICGLDMVGALLLAGFAAIILHPLVYGNLGSSVMALMTPVK